MTTVFFSDETRQECDEAGQEHRSRAGFVGECRNYQELSIEHRRRRFFIDPCYLICGEEQGGGEQPAAQELHLGHTSHADHSAVRHEADVERREDSNDVHAVPRDSARSCDDGRNESEQRDGSMLEVVNDVVNIQPQRTVAISSCSDVNASYVIPITVTPLPTGSIDCAANEFPPFNLELSLTDYISQATTNIPNTTNVSDTREAMLHTPPPSTLQPTPYSYDTCTEENSTSSTKFRKCASNTCTIYLSPQYEKDLCELCCKYSSLLGLLKQPLKE